MKISFNDIIVVAVSRALKHHPIMNSTHEGDEIILHEFDRTLEIEGIDLNDEWEDVLEKITTSQHTRMPVYYDSIDSSHGFLHLRNVLALMGEDKLTPVSLLEAAQPNYFLPEGTPLNTQLLKFQRN